MGGTHVVDNYYEEKQRAHERFMQTIHKAIVTDVYVDKGTVMVSMEGVDDHPREIVFPLVAISFPSKISENDHNELRTSWFRYIPQQGDVILVGYDSNGELYSLGYYTGNYIDFKRADDAREARGGIGWGEASGKTISPGDFDIKSSRNSSVYIGDKLKLASGPHSVTMNKSKGDITTITTLVDDLYGESSELRMGSARRFLLPTDTSETYIYGAFVSVAQEYNNVVRRGMIGTPNGIEMVRHSMGEVIDEATKLPMVPSTILATLTGVGVRKLESVKDPLGATNLYVEVIDDLGNYGMSAPTAIIFNWSTPLANWSMTNSSFSVESLTFIKLKSEVSVSLESALIQLGGVEAVSSVIKGTEFLAAMNTFLTAMTAATTGVVTPAQVVTAIAGINAAVMVLQSSMSNVLSTAVFTK